MQEKMSDVYWLLRVCIRTIEHADNTGSLFAFMPEFYLNVAMNSYSALKNYFSPSNSMEELPGHYHFIHLKWTSSILLVTNSLIVMQTVIAIYCFGISRWIVSSFCIVLLCDTLDDVYLGNIWHVIYGYQCIFWFLLLYINNKWGAFTVTFKPWEQNCATSWSKKFFKSIFYDYIFLLCCVTQHVCVYCCLYITLRLRGNAHTACHDSLQALRRSAYRRDRWEKPPSYGSEPWTV